MTSRNSAAPAFQSFFLGGFECSTHRRRDRRRLDILAATRHDDMAETDYRLLRDVGIETMRDGTRWHRIEQSPGRYDWSSLLPMLQAARRADVQVIWDLMHYGWPDGLDIRSAAFVDRFARYAATAAQVIEEESGKPPLLSIVNEISFMAWAAGTVGIFEPFGERIGAELKRQLVRATIAASHAIREVTPQARFFQIEPLIRILPDPARSGSRLEARRRADAQFEAWDMLAGRTAPELGGSEDLLDVIGINFYCHNQWIVDGPPLDWRTDPRWRPLSGMLADISRRYGRPLFIAETGIEGDLRPSWLRMVSGEVARAQAMGVPVLGICLYPVMNHPGWDDERHCPNGLIDYDRETFARSLDRGLLEELTRQQALLETVDRDVAADRYRKA